MTATVVALPRGAKRILDGRQVFGLYPKSGGSVRSRWLYAIGFDDGKTKIGISHRPYARMVQHWTASEGRIQWTHLFACFDSSRAASIERLACVKAAVVSNRIGRTESFRGLGRDEAIRCVRAAIAERIDARDRLLEIV